MAVAAALAVCLLAAGAHPVAATDRIARVALLPVENLAGGAAPVDEVGQFLAERLASSGISVLDQDALQAFLARHRVRYAAGIDAETAQSLRTETGVDGVVVASLDLASDIVPPKFAVTLRLIAITGEPVVVWAQDAGLAGDDAPGLFGLGLVNEYRVLADKALNGLAGSMVEYLKTGKRSGEPTHASKFRPKMFYSGRAIEAGKTYSVAVVPFFNVSERRNAGEILALLCIRHLSDMPEFRVLDTGVVRRQLLDARVIMDGGISLTDGETVAALLEADFVLGGRVIRYVDYEGPGGTARVDFSTVLIERRTRRVVWSSTSYNDSGDGVGMFGRGTSRTAHAMATQMVRLTAEALVGRDR
jgi:hypothetical protein